ncbi:MAG: Mth938-like domain-containing protein [Magnetovibrionaceae bacterium]
MAVDISPIIEEGRQVVQKYGGGNFTISGEVYGQSVIVFPNRTLAWGATGPETIDEAGLAPIFEAADTLDILLIGAGPKFTPPPVPLRNALKAVGIVLDWMDTGAACRTYNVLMSEDRAVAAALVAVD